MTNLLPATKVVFVGVAIVLSCSANNFALALASIVIVLETSLVLPTY